MNTPVVLAERSSSGPAFPPDGELSLAALLDLFTTEDAAPAPVRLPLRSYAARIAGWVQECSRRAAEWGAVPGVRGNRSSLRASGEVQ